MAGGCVAGGSVDAGGAVLEGSGGTVVGADAGGSELGWGVGRVLPSDPVGETVVASVLVTPGRVSVDGAAALVTAPVAAATVVGSAVVATATVAP